MDKVYELVYFLIIKFEKISRKIKLNLKYLFVKNSIRKISLILAMWDSEQLIAMGCPDDEYDGEARKLWKRLPNNNKEFWDSEIQIKEFIRNGIRDIFIEMFATSIECDENGLKYDTEGNEIRIIDEKMKEVYSRPEYAPDWVIDKIYNIIRNL